MRRTPNPMPGHNSRRPLNRRLLIMVALVLTAGGLATAQIMSASGETSPRSEPAKDLYDSLAPIVPAPQCDGQCVATNTVVYQGDLAPGVEKQVDVRSLVQAEGDWVASLDLSSASNESADDIDLKFEPGLPDPDLVDATLLLGPQEVQTVRLIPDDFNSFTVTNLGDSTASVTITAIGWTPGLDKKERRIESQIEKGIDRHEALDTPLEVGSRPVVVPAEITVEPCIPNMPCVTLAEEAIASKDDRTPAQVPAEITVEPCIPNMPCVTLAEESIASEGDR